MHKTTTKSKLVNLILNSSSYILKPKQLLKGNLPSIDSKTKRLRIREQCSPLQRPKKVIATTCLTETQEIQSITMKTPCCY